MYHLKAKTPLLSSHQKTPFIQKKKKKTGKKPHIYSAGRRLQFGVENLSVSFVFSIIDQICGSSHSGKQFVYTDRKGTWHTFLSSSHLETTVLAAFLLLMHLVL